MTPTTAAKLLELPADATPEQIEARFLELRRKLEDKIARAPTPGLQAKYRDSLNEVILAFETLTLAADSSSLPVLQKLSDESSGGALTPKSTAPAITAAPPAVSIRLNRRKSAGKEFTLVAAIAIAALGAGGWWVLKTKRANEEKARIAAKAQAEHERQVAAAKADRERTDRLLTSLRSQVAELNVAYDAQMRIEQISERELSELKSKERDASREQNASASPEYRRLTAQVRVQENLVAWLRETLPSHPARFAKARAEEMLSARAADEAASAVTNYASQLEQLKKDIAAARAKLAVTGPLKLMSNLEGTTWQLSDAFGVQRSGTAPSELREVAYGTGTVSFQRPGWPEQHLSYELRPGATQLTAQFPIGSVRVESKPAGAQVFRDGKLIGRTPLELPQLPPGAIAVRVSEKGFKSERLAGQVETGKTLRFEATLSPGRSPDAQFIFSTVAEDLALIGDPELRASTALSLLIFAGQLEGLSRQTLQPVLTAHLQACRAIRDPEKRFDALSAAMTIVPQFDFERSRLWAEEGVKALAAWTDPFQRKFGYSSPMKFAVHPELAAKMLGLFANWQDSSESFGLGQIAQRQKRLGFDAEAERTASRARSSSSIPKDLERGAAERPYALMQVALGKRDLAAARAALARASISLDFDDMLSLAREFMRLGDFESPLRLAELGQNQNLTINQYIFSLIRYASYEGNHALAELWAARLPDTAEHRLRSRTYQNLAEHYLDFGLKQEALAAANRISMFSPGNNRYASDRFEAATLFAVLGETDRARQLVASAPTTFDKEYSDRVRAAAALFHLLGDTTSRDRAMRALGAGEPARMSWAYVHLITTLCRAGRADEAASFLSQISTSDAAHFAQVQIAKARVRLARDEELDALAEKTQPGQQRAMLFVGILAQEANRQKTARFRQAR
jgi:hypothetical protein